MLRRHFVMALVGAFALCECSTDRYGAERNDAPKLTSTLHAAIDADVEGLVVIGGDRYGYPLEIIEAYGASCGRDADLSVGLHSTHIGNSLREGDIEIAVTPAPDDDMISVPLYTTGYAMLAHRRTSLGAQSGTVYDKVGERTVVVTPGFEHTESYGALLDSVPRARIFVSSKDACELAGDVAAGKFDFLICERGEASLARSTVAGLRSVWDFDEEVEIFAAFDKRHRALCDDFRAWLEAYRSSGEHTALRRKYLDGDFGTQLRRINRYTRVVGGISVWDELIREVGANENIDWKLLSAIAYSESRFDEGAVSGAGAQGIMQIMPVVARHFNVDQELIADPKTNVTLGARLIKCIEQTLDFAPGAAPEDRLRITLAAYNSGVGTVCSARRIAEANGGDPDSWDVVSRCLAMMGDGNFGDDSVSYRRFNGSGETIAFVTGVMERYDTYKRLF